MENLAKQNTIEQLQQQILRLQGDQTPSELLPPLGLGEIESAFPGKVFPRAAVHELISPNAESAASTNAFLSVLLSKLIQPQNKFCVWVSTNRKIYPAALKSFGVQPERILFVDARKTKDALWAIEEALKCNAVSSVVGELNELNFDESRRLQLAVEKSKVTGFIHRPQPKILNAVACVTRWRITPLESASIDKMPGLGFSRWQVELLKVRNGKPGKWIVQYSPNGLECISESDKSQNNYHLRIA